MRAKKVDTNHGEVVKALRKIGGRVLDLSGVGKGCPDLLVAYRGRNILMEVKYEKGPLTKDQVEFIATWGGEMHVVRSTEEAIAALVGKEAMA